MMFFSRRWLFRKSLVHLAPKTVNSVTLIGVIHDLQKGYVYEEAVTQFTLTTTSIDTTNPSQECVVEKDHHTVRCFGDAFSKDTKEMLKEGNIVCVNGRLRLNPQLEPSCNKHFYFPFIHVQKGSGSVCVVQADRSKSPAMASSSSEVPANPSGTESATNGNTAPAT